MTEIVIKSLQYDVLLYSVAWWQMVSAKAPNLIYASRSHQAAISTCETPVLWRKAEQLCLDGIGQDVLRAC